MDDKICEKNLKHLDCRKDPENHRECISLAVAQYTVEIG